VQSLSRIGETILLALMGTVFGVLFSAPLSFLGARNLMGVSPVGRAVYWVVRLIFTITRSIEVLILGVIMVVIVGIGSYAGVLAIVVHSIGSLGKLYSEAIESTEPGPVEAITATGASRLSTVLYGVVPQVIPSFLAVTIFWWDHNVRMSTVLGLVGGGGIGYLLIQYMNLLQFNQAATVLWMIVIVVTVMDYASAAIRARLV
jgi:phosphonate transport system permease protein